MRYCEWCFRVFWVFLEPFKPLDHAAVVSPTLLDCLNSMEDAVRVIVDRTATPRARGVPHCPTPVRAGAQGSGSVAVGMVLSVVCVVSMMSNRAC